MCGEKIDAAPVRVKGPGSPPRVRGKVFSFPSTQFAIRITPACAGKSHYTTAKDTVNGDHPRVCGEKTKYQTTKGALSGSPPRVRGKD